jgi:uncharacterized protein YkwD
MKKIFLAIFLAFPALVFLAFLVSKVFTPSPAYKLVLGEYRQDNIRLVNAERAKQNLQPLEENEQLNQSAQMKADDMAAKDYWSHDAPDGTKPWWFFYEAGYVYKYAGENLARDDYEPVEAIDFMDDWMASPTHREIILSPKFRDIGVGVALNGEGIYVVNHFGVK